MLVLLALVLAVLLLLQYRTLPVLSEIAAA